jgi:hypothetical protein
MQEGSLKQILDMMIIRATCGLAASHKRVASEAPTKCRCPAQGVDRIQSLYSLDRNLLLPL